MIFLLFDKDSETRAVVTLRHYQPQDLSEEVLSTGLLVDILPKPENTPGKRDVLYVNPQNKDLWYEYEDIPLPDEERIAQLERENDELKKSNLDTQEAILELYEMIMGAPQT